MLIQFEIRCRHTHCCSRTSGGGVGAGVRRRQHLCRPRRPRRRLASLGVGRRQNLHERCREDAVAVVFVADNVAAEPAARLLDDVDPLGGLEVDLVIAIGTEIVDDYTRSRMVNEMRLHPMALSSYH